MDEYLKSSGELIFLDLKSNLISSKSVVAKPLS